MEVDKAFISSYFVRIMQLPEVTTALHLQDMTMVQLLDDAVSLVIGFFGF